MRRFVDRFVAAVCCLSGAASGLTAPRAGPSGLLTRRAIVAQAAATALGISLAPARAAEGEEREAPRQWISGRSDPIRPTSKDKPDGTKKDPRYLNCLNDCVPQCLGPPGSAQKERLECLEQCQTDCCFTYSQCTYRVLK